MAPSPYPKKLIEVALPLDAINTASRREKSIRHGHPSTLHLWWSRKPLATTRAVLFAQLVDDPSAHPEQFPTEAAQAAERERLFGILQQLVIWENSTKESVLAEARAEILRSTGGTPPPVYDPFCGGGSIPLEAQRLGLDARGSDLNPVAVLISKALVEIPPRFRGRPPVHPGQHHAAYAGAWQGAAGLAEDLRYYGEWMRQAAEARIGSLYPPATLPPEQGGGPARVIAWLWVRTVASPNPALGGTHVPLTSKWVLSSRKGHEAYVEPISDSERGTYRFEVRTKGTARVGTVNRKGATCLLSGVPIPFDYIRTEGRAGRLGVKLLAIVADGPRGRIYLPPDAAHEEAPNVARPDWEPTGEIADNPGHTNVYRYGLTTFAKLFTPRQLTALTTFSDLIPQCRAQVLQDAQAAGLPDDGVSLNEGGRGATAYADAVATYMALAVDKLSDYGSALCSWHVSGEKMRNTFARQALPMVWDFAEANPFSASTGNWSGAVDWVVKAVTAALTTGLGQVRQADATTPGHAQGVVVSTDPPYYDNIGYADLADFFYVWLRRSLRDLYPNLFGTLLTPKATELVATPYRFPGGRTEAKAHFEGGLHQAFVRLRAESDPAYPLTVYYAFKQADSEDNGEGQEPGAAEFASTGWETMLTGLLQAGFAVVGTWPMRTEMGNRPVANGTNSLASSIVVVCRVRPDEAGAVSRREFLRMLHAELPPALRALQAGQVAPVDFAQAAIGPGMAVFSRYARVLETDGSAMPVRAALTLINQVLDAVLAEQEGEYDPATRWAIKWATQYGWRAGSYGEAEVLSKAQALSLAHWQGRMLEAKAGKVRLLGLAELEPGWRPPADVTAWEAAHHLAAVLMNGGEEQAADLLARLPAVADAARDVAYQLYHLCERRGWAADALPYNMLVSAWPALQQLQAARVGRPMAQGTLLDPEGV